jgi:hypothetical protein
MQGNYKSELYAARFNVNIGDVNHIEYLGNQPDRERTITLGQLIEEERFMHMEFDVGNKSVSNLPVIIRGPKGEKGEKGDKGEKGNVDLKDVTIIEDEGSIRGGLRLHQIKEGMIYNKPGSIWRTINAHSHADRGGCLQTMLETIMRYINKERGWHTLSVIYEGGDLTINKARFKIVKMHVTEGLNVGIYTIAEIMKRVKSDTHSVWNLGWSFGGISPYGEGLWLWKDSWGTVSPLGQFRRSLRQILDNSGDVEFCKTKDHTQFERPI